MIKVTDSQKQQVQKVLQRFGNIVIVTTTLVAGFGIGYYFHKLQSTKQTLPTTSLQEASPAIDYQGCLLLDNKKYSDSTLRVITRMGVKHLYQ